MTFTFSTFRVIPDNKFKKLFCMWPECIRLKLSRTLQFPVHFFFTYVLKQHFLLYVRLNKLQNRSPYDEKSLLLQVAEGNEQAFRQLFDTYRRKLYTYLLKISKSTETAEDSVHDIFLKLWIGREKLPQIQNLNAYLYRMAHNHAFNGLRKMATETLVLAELQSRGIREPEDPDISLGRKEVRRFIHEAISKLTPKQREVFQLSRELGLKQEEIAQRLGISVLTVKSHLTDALNYLRTEISTHYSIYSGVLFVLWRLGS